MTTPPATPTASFAAKLRSVHVGLREDLEVTRHLFRGQPSYVIRDPLTFQSQRLDPADYDVLVRLNASQPLGEIFENLVTSGKSRREDEEPFYQFVFMLHRLGFLRLPVSDDRALYKRFQMKEAARRKERRMGVLFLRVPLINPDAFLDRTMRYARPLFSRTAFVLWCALMLAAGMVAWSQRNELRQPIEGILAARNLPLMWITLIVLKLFHEFGHAYACKHYGGHVPEMGAYLILLTPCAYVDASASWGFTFKRERLIVCLGGMYFESIIAAIAVFVWSFTEPSIVRSLAFNVIFLAGTITVLFNINPLMKYDGYYMLSDLTEIPNLRARASGFAAALAKRLFLGIRLTEVGGNRRPHWLIATYGILAIAYRAVLVLGIAALIASKVFLLGLSLAALYVGHAAVGFVRKLLHYLLESQETAHVRWRAVALSALVIGGIPAALLFIPVPAAVRATGVVGREKETVVRAATAGFVSEVLVQAPDETSENDTLVVLTADAPAMALLETEGALRASRLRQDALRQLDPAGALAEQAQIAAHQRAVDRARADLANLRIRSPVSGSILDGLRDRDLGTYLAEGASIALVGDGCWRVRAVLTQDQVAAAAPRIGQTVEFRAASDPGRTLCGTVAGVAPIGSRKVAHQPLTLEGGGEIAINPATGEANQPFFELTIDLPSESSPNLRHGMTGVARLPAGAETMAKRGWRRLTRFIDKLIQQ